MTKRKSPAGGGLRCGGAGVGMEIAAKEKARRGRGEVQGEGTARGGGRRPPRRSRGRRAEPAETVRRTVWPAAVRAWLQEKLFMQ